MMAKAANRTNLAAPMEPPIQLLLSGAHRLDGHLLILARAALESLEFVIGGARFLRPVDTDPVGGLLAALLWSQSPDLRDADGCGRAGSRLEDHLFGLAGFLAPGAGAELCAVVIGHQTYPGVALERAFLVASIRTYDVQPGAAGCALHVVGVDLQMCGGAQAVALALDRK